MGRHAKSTRGGNKHRINPGRLAKKFTKQGLSERNAQVAAHTATRLAKGSAQPASADDANAVPVAAAEQLPLRPVAAAAAAPAAAPMSTKSAIAHALAALKQQRASHEDRSVVRQAQRRK